MYAQRLALHGAGRCAFLAALLIRLRQNIAPACPYEMKQTTNMSITLRGCMATERMDEQWVRIRDRIKSVWSHAEFDDKEMRKTRGNLTKMVNLIHAQTGDPLPEIRQKVISLI